MKRLGNIYGQICNYANLLNAFGKVQLGKSSRADIREWSEQLEKRLNQLLDDLSNSNYRFGDYYVFQVYDPKKRTIYAASVRERIIHHAVINVCGEWLEKCLIDDSYACRKGKGQYSAVLRAQEFAQRYPWCLKLDIKTYFDTIDQKLMMQLLEQRIKDPQVLKLFSELLCSYAIAPGKGLPIGNLTSQYFANLYLNIFDRWISEVPNRGYVRYMDDMLVFGFHDDLRDVLRQAHIFLRDRLQLTIKNGGCLQPVSRGVDFLGYRVFPQYLLLNQRSKRRFRKKMRELDEALLNGECTEAEYQARATALTAFVQHANTYRLRGRICGENE